MNEVVKVNKCIVDIVKADIPLQPDESFDEFMKRLRKAVIAQINDMKLPHKVQSCYTEELKDKTLVVEFYWALDSPKDITETVDLEQWACYQGDWAVDGTGFKFSNWTPVERKTTWVKKVKVEKRAPNDLWKGAV